jgi:hypothetical protein
MDNTEPREEQEKIINSAYEVAIKLFNQEFNERTTNVINTEVANLDLIISLGERIDTYSKKFLKYPDEYKCFLTRLAERNLRIRMSINGWRSNQAVSILQSPPVSNNFTNQQQPPNINTGGGSLRPRI